VVSGMQPKGKRENRAGDSTARCFFDIAEMRVLLFMFGASLV
jgi:hypothetical protein